MTSTAGQKPLDLGSKFVSAERALAAIRAGSRVYIGTGCAAPRTLLTRLEAMDPAPADLEFVSFLTTSALAQVEGASRTHYRHRAFFVGSEMRGLAASGQLDYVPISLEEVPLPPCYSAPALVQTGGAFSWNSFPPPNLRERIHGGLAC